MITLPRVQPHLHLIKVATVDDIKEGVIFTVFVRDCPVGLTRVDGVIHAFGDICTHDGGPLAEGVIEGMCVICPRHGAKFNLKTGKPTFPAVERTPIYPVEIDGADVKILIE